MATYDDFVGREEQLEQLREYAEAWGKRIMVVIEADGGMGKTFLLRKFESEYKDDLRFVIDFYDLAEQPPGDVLEAQHLMKSLGEDSLSKFEDKLRDLIHSSEDPQEREKRREVLFDTAKQELERATKERRLIRIVDTLDIGIPDYIWKEDEFLRLMEVPNILLVVAGRRAKAGAKQLRPKFDQVHEWNLSEFTPEESMQLFDSDEISRALMPDDIKRKIHFLSSGRPIYLTLAITWFHRNALPDFIEKQTLTELEQLSKDSKEAFEKLQEQFRFELLAGIRSLERPIDRAVFYMSLLDRHNNSELLATLMDIEENEAKQILKELAKLPFVKVPYSSEDECCLLHDEMRALIKKYVWPVLDPWNVYRRDVLERLRSTYQKQLDKLRVEVQDSSDLVAELQAEWKLWRLEAEYLHYLLQLDESDALHQFDKWHKEARESEQVLRMEMLLYEMEKLKDNTQVLLAKADLLRRYKQWIDVNNICRNILGDENASISDRISAYIHLGWIAVEKEGSPREALQEFNKALQLAEEEDNDLNTLIKLYDNIAQMHNRLFQFNEAIKAAQSALRKIKEKGKTDTIDKNLIGDITGNLAYAYGRQANLDAAQLYGILSIQLREQELHKAYGYQTMASIQADEGDYSRSIRSAQKALSIFEKKHDQWGRVLALSTLARSLRHQGEYEKAEKRINEAISLAEELNDKALLADLHNVRGRSKRALGEEMRSERLADTQDAQEVDRHFKEALKDFLTSIEYAEASGNTWVQARSNFEIAMLYYYATFLGGLDQAQRLNEAQRYLDKVLEKDVSKEHIFRGHVEEMYGLIEVERKNYAKAGKAMGRAAFHLGQIQGKAVQLFKQRLIDLLLGDSPLTGDERTEIGGHISREIQERVTQESSGGDIEFKSRDMLQFIEQLNNAMTLLHISSGKEEENEGKADKG